MNDLNFQSFSNDFSTNSTNEQSGFTGGSIGDRDRNILVDDNVSTAGSSRNLFSVNYYQQYFDVDTEMVFKRILNSVVPTNNNFILDFVQPLPDLWGPFWISVTLVFSIGIFGNIAQYIESEGSGSGYESDFRLVTSASTIIFLYVVFVPILIFSILWHRKSDLQYPYLDIVCAYGYSLTIFIPVSLLWILDINWFRWALIFTSVTLSGSVLAKAIYPAFKNDSNRLVAFGSVFVVLFLHFLLAFGFKEFFFDSMHASKTEIVNNVASAASQTIANISGPSSNVTLSPTLPGIVYSTPLATNTTTVLSKTTVVPADQSTTSSTASSTTSSTTSPTPAPNTTPTAIPANVANNTTVTPITTNSKNTTATITTSTAGAPQTNSTKSP